MKRLWIILTAFLAFNMSVLATLIVNGDMSTSTFGDNSTDSDTNHMGFGEEDMGWIRKSGWSLTANANQMTLGSTINDGLAQINSITSEVGSQLQVQFDWIAPAGASGTDLNLNYQVVGWQDPGGALTAGEQMFRFINGGSASVGSGATATKVDFLALSDVGAGNDNLSRNALVGTAGVLVQADFIINLSTLGAGKNDISNYDYFGIRFNVGEDSGTNVNNPTASGGILDNVSVAVVIPEPSSLALSLFGLLSLRAFRRQKKA